MRFKTKDLMVSISPNLEIDAELAAKLCLWRTRICIRPTLDPCWHSFGCHPCTWRFSCLCSVRGTVGCGQFNSCGPDGSTCDPTIFCGGHTGFEIEDPADLVTLQGELKDVLRRLDQLQEEGLPAQLSSTSELDAAEEALKGALAEIQRQRRNQ